MGSLAFSPYQNESFRSISLNTYASGQRRASWAPGFGSTSLDVGRILRTAYPLESSSPSLVCLSGRSTAILRMA